MSKYIWLFLAICSGIFILGVALIDIFKNDTADSLIIDPFMLILVSALAALFSLWLVSQLDYRKPSVRAGIFLPLLVALVSIMAYTVLQTKLPIYFARLFIGFIVLFYVGWKIIEHKKHNLKSE